MHEEFGDIGRKFVYVFHVFIVTYHRKIIIFAVQLLPIHTHYKGYMAEKCGILFVHGIVGNNQIFDFLKPLVRDCYIKYVGIVFIKSTDEDTSQRLVIPKRHKSSYGSDRE